VAHADRPTPACATMRAVIVTLMVWRQFAGADWTT